MRDIKAFIPFVFAVVFASFYTSAAAAELADDTETSTEPYNLGYKVGFFDGRETLEFNPGYPSLDEDGDDNWEVVHGLDRNDANSDPDGDLLNASRQMEVKC